MPEMPDEEGFEAWLREGATHHPRAGFEAELRRRFLAGAQAEGEAPGTDPRSLEDPFSDNISLSQAEDAARKASVQSDFETFLQRHPGPHEARDAFRDELRQRFLGDAATHASDPGRVRPAPRPASAARPRGRLLRFAPLAGVAAAAAVLFLILPRFEQDRQPDHVAELPAPDTTTGPGGTSSGSVPTVAARWSLESFDPGTRVRLDGEPFDPTVLGPDELHDRLLAAGDEVAVDAGRMTLVFGDQVGMEIQPGSRLEFVAGGPALGLRAGEVYLTTFDGYPGHGLEVTTHDTQVLVHGTTLGVLVDPEGTCVCVAEGEVQLAAAGTQDPTASVPEQHKHFLFREKELGDFRMGFPDLEDPNLSAAERQHTAGLQAFFERSW